MINLTPTINTFRKELAKDNGKSLFSHETACEIFEMQSPMAKRIMFKLVKRSPMSTWTDAGAVSIFERWTAMARSHQGDLFKRKIRAKGLPLYETLERAAIHEYDGGLPRWQAEALALGEHAGLEEIE